MARIAEMVSPDCRSVHFVSVAQRVRACTAFAAAAHASCIKGREGSKAWYVVKAPRKNALWSPWGGHRVHGARLVLSAGQGILQPRTITRPSYQVPGLRALSVKSWDVGKAHAFAASELCSNG